MSGAAMAIEEWRPRVNPWLIAAAVMLSTFMEVLDSTIVSVAQPNMAGALASTNDEASWVLTSYLVANAVVLPASGWFAVRFGRRNFLLACTALFTVMSVLCGLAPTMGFLVLARVLQGAAGGALQPLSQAILMESFPVSKRGIANAVFALGVVIAPVIGPVTGGWLTDHLSWRWVFYINVPFGVASLYMMMRYIEDPPYIRQAVSGRMDGVGFGFLTLWLGSLQIVLDRGQQEDWFASRFILMAGIVSVGSLLLFLWRELTTDGPIVDLTILKDRNFGVGCTLILLAGAGMYGSLTILPLFLQTLLGYTAEAAGMATMPRGIGALLGSVLTGYLVSKVDGRVLCGSGFAIFGISSLLLARLNVEVAMSSIIVPNILQGLGIALIFVSLMTLAMGLMPNERIGNATSVYNLARNLGGSIGISLSSAWVIRFAQMHQSDMVAHLTPYDGVFRSRFDEMVGQFAANGGTLQTAQQQAFGMLQNVLLQQASLKAYMTVFAATGLVMIACVPVVLLIRRVRSSGQVMMH